MLSIFPSLLIFGILAPFILRVIVGVYFLHAGYLDFGKEEGGSLEEITKKHGKYAKPFLTIFAIAEVVVGLSLIVGLFTQVAALIGIIFVLKFLWFKNEFPIFIKHEKVFYFMVLTILFSLLLTGAGALAIDLPL